MGATNALVPVGYIASVAIGWSAIVYINPEAFQGLMIVLSPAPINIAVSLAFLLVGSLLSRRLDWKGFFGFTFSVAIVLSAFASALNEGIDPGDGSLIGTFLGSFLFFLTYGCLGVLGFHLAQHFAPTKSEKREGIGDV
jgi:hypothetical protein